MTRLLNAVEARDAKAASELLSLVYDELRKLAHVRMSQEKPGLTIQPTALVHEAYIRLVGGEERQQWYGRGHFFAAAAEAMRRILIDQARQRSADKHGGKQRRVPLTDYADSDADEQLLHLDEALTQLAAQDPLSAKVVELHHFAGLTQTETALAMGITEYQIRQKWTFARAWLKSALKES